MTEDKMIWDALYKHPDGYWYYKVPTSLRRNNIMRISQKKYKELKYKFGRSAEEIKADIQQLEAKRESLIDKYILPIETKLERLRDQLKQSNPL